MARINLLPWREREREEKKKRFFKLAGLSVALAAAAFGFVHWFVNGMIEHQQTLNSYLEREIKEVEAKIKEIDELEKKKDQLLARMRVIEELQRNRPEVVHVFEEIVKATPDGIYLRNLGQMGRTLVFEGDAQSNARVSSFMRNLEASPWFKDPVLDFIESSKAQGKGAVEETRKFKLRVTQDSVKEEAPEETPQEATQ